MKLPIDPRWILGGAGALLVLLVIRTRRALWATFLLGGVVVGVGLMVHGLTVPVLLHGIIVFVIGGAAFWLIDMTRNRFLALIVGALGIAALVYFSK
ncbi:MAG TPA: hypothetical protein VGP80_05880 [Gemmatimonadales bacterium]|nr:hypothetical protein [Gemmatimonadales bacterium]